jgi:hypothetical protein
MIRDAAATDWWNKLSREQRLAVASALPQNLPQPGFGAGFDWTLPWEQLLPFTQQLRLQIYRVVVVRDLKSNREQS